jgi:hypothetical protein
MEYIVKQFISVVEREYRMLVTQQIKDMTIDPTSMNQRSPYR